MIKFYEDYEKMLYNQKKASEYSIYCLNCVKTLGLTPFRDGNQWCFLWGENLQEGVVGFGDSIMEACENFQEGLHKKIDSKEPEVYCDNTRLYNFTCSYNYCLYCGGPLDTGFSCIKCGKKLAH